MNSDASDLPFAERELVNDDWPSDRAMLPEDVDEALRRVAGGLIELAGRHPEESLEAEILRFHSRTVGHIRRQVRNLPAYPSDADSEYPRCCPACGYPVVDGQQYKGIYIPGQRCVYCGHHEHARGNPRSGVHRANKE